METLKEFLDVLSANTDKELLFEYAPGLLVGANYHITEVKNVHIDSVDCGGQADSWDETIIQLWESPDEIGKKDYMTVVKALQILQVVSKVKAFKMNSKIKIEYSNSQFHTANLDIKNVTVKEGQLILNLHVLSTDCKAKDLCGIPAEPQNSCAPGSGCC